MEILGIDVGGSGIKGAPVDPITGQLLSPRLRYPTPLPSKPVAVAEVIARIARDFEWEQSIGCGFPSAVHNGVAMTAANIHKKWIGMNVAELFASATNCPVCVINDADAAGLAEMNFGAGRGCKGLVIIVTIGTGLGTSLFTDGHLVANTELGHIEINGQEAEKSASDAARKAEGLSWKRWGARLNTYLNKLEYLFWPDVFILGGGISKQFLDFKEYLNLRAEVLQAQLLNEAGIVGAALAAQECEIGAWSIPLVGSEN